MLRDEVVVVTGASRGLGKALAEELGRQGSSVVLLARDETSLNNVQQSIAENGGTAHAVRCDVASWPDVQNAVKAATAHFGRISGLVCNAGVGQPFSLVEDANPLEWRATIDTNLLGAFHCCRAVLPGLLLARRGTIVSVSSGLSKRPTSERSAYCASKAALDMLTACVAAETVSRGLRVFSVAPGLVDTDMQAVSRRAEMSMHGTSTHKDLRPPAEAARALAWLFSDDASDLTGQVIDVRDSDFRRRAGLPPLTSGDVRGFS